MKYDRVCTAANWDTHFCCFTIKILSWVRYCQLSSIFSISWHSYFKSLIPFFLQFFIQKYGQNLSCHLNLQKYLARMIKIIVSPFFSRSKQCFQQKFTRKVWKSLSSSKFEISIFLQHCFFFHVSYSWMNCRKMYRLIAHKKPWNFMKIFCLSWIERVTYNEQIIFTLQVKLQFFQQFKTEYEAVCWTLSIYQQFFILYMERWGITE